MANDNLTWDRMRMDGLCVCVCILPTLDGRLFSITRINRILVGELSSITIVHTHK